MAQKKKFYAVRCGHKPGVYWTWEECKTQVDGYSNADYKGFSTLKDAEDYLGGGVRKLKPPSAEQVSGRNRAATSMALRGVGQQRASLKRVVIYTDGACTGNPGPGGYGVVLIHGEQRKELFAGFRLTTNNRMEILGCIAGLKGLKEPCEVTIYSDSRYVVNTMTKSWALRWRKHDWKRKDGNGEWKDALNSDLWAQMLDLCDRHWVSFKWVRGHSGNEGNERCDQLARAAAASGRLGIDAAYENPTQKRDSVFGTMTWLQSIER
jgi:ribonuclease HI